MTEPQIPLQESDLTTDWLANCLEPKFTGISQSLDGVAVEQIGVGVGLMANLYRCHLSYTASGAEFPVSVVVKTSNDDPASAKLAKTLDLYRREYDFYVNVQPASKMRSPELLFGAYDKKRNLFVLVLEDLQSMNAYSQLDGATPEQAMLAIKELGRFHGQFWNRTDAPELAGAYDISTLVSIAVVQLVYRSNVDPAIEKFPQHFSPDVEAVVREFGRRIVEVMMLSNVPDLTYVHGDYRLDNMFFGDDGELTVLDWQVAGISTGFYDVAYFLCGSLTPETRAEVERDAIEEYCKAVSAEAGTNLEFEVGWELYRRATLTCLLTVIVVSGELDLSVDRSNDLIIEGLKRNLKAIEELNAAEYLATKPSRMHPARIITGIVNSIFALSRVFRRR